MMTKEERVSLLRRTIDSVWNKGELDALDELYAAHCTMHDPTFPVDGVGGTREFIRELRAAQPDLHMDVQDVLVAGDMTAYRFTCGATATGEFKGLPATGRSYVMTGMTMSKWEDDRIVEEWTNYDMLGALQQLGLIPERLTHEASA